MTPPFDTYYLNYRPQHLQPLSEHQRTAAKLFAKERPNVWKFVGRLLAIAARRVRLMAPKAFLDARQ